MIDKEQKVFIVDILEAMKQVIQEREKRVKSSTTRR